MAHETISANQRQGETNQEIMKQPLSILENSNLIAPCCIGKINGWQLQINNKTFFSPFH